MLRLLVSPEVNLPLEGAAAKVAGEGLESGVFAAVRDEVGRLAESLPAHRALVGLLTCRRKKETELLSGKAVHCGQVKVIHG